MVCCLIIFIVHYNANRISLQTQVLCWFGKEKMPRIVCLFTNAKCVGRSQCLYCLEAICKVNIRTIYNSYIQLFKKIIYCSLFETTQTLFWAVFGLVDLDSFELDGIKIFTRFWGMLMFGTYSVINIVVLLNLLIAMMNHSYQLISVSVKTN